MPCDDHLIMHIQIPPHNMQVLLADFYLSEISVTYSSTLSSLINSAFCVG